MSSEVPSPADLRVRLRELGLRDSRRLGRRLDAARKGTPERRAAVLEKIARDLVAAEQALAARAAGVPRLDYPEQLPVSQKKDEILEALRTSQVVVVAGETGSGKTTQIPKICLELGRGVKGLIGHTQPRRIAARAVAERLSEELGSPLGEAVGYKVRFHDQVGDASYVKLMTDGVLLAEMQHDRLLSAYDTIIIDEAHERSLNIDFLLGYLKQLLPRRPDLKVVITSATIETERFSEHFGGAPVIEVSGRTFPVEVRYRPRVAEDEDDEDVDQVTAIADAVDELCALGPGDVLVFLSGEREIRDTADVLRGRVPEGTDVLPLFGRLSAQEQHRVFAGHTGRRVVLATNVAETSLTVPGIRYVVDAGTARISRYSMRTKVQRLPIEPISQASAKQRAGRCGRVAEGVCIRLYSEEDFLSRPEFTDPEVLRTNLASVILQMTALGLGDLEAFPFVQPPDRRNVRDGVQLLEELGALSDRGLTETGRRLAQLPLDPRLGRMVLEADRNGCLREVLVIAAALSIQDPRERPSDKQQAAAEMHARFKDETSDFLAYLSLWEYLREQQRELSSSAFRRLCKREFLSWLRIREWQDLHSQLRRVVRGLDMSLDSAEPDAGRIHLSLLAGLLSHIGLRDPEKREYLGARGARFAVVPGSALYRKQPRFLMAAELVETNRMWARVVARVEPEWAEKLGAHLVKRSYSEPHWERKRAAVMATERVTLYGVPLVAARKVGYSQVDPAMCRDIFLRSALVEGDWETHHAFWQHNTALLEDVEKLEDKARRRDIRVDDQTVYDFYDARIPADVVSGRHFDAWWKRARRETPQLLDLTLEALAQDVVDLGAYPDVWTSESLALPLDYAFAPGTPRDGVTVQVPLAVLNQVRQEEFEWLVPGLRQDLVVALLKSLPKSLRVAFVPAPDTARAVLEVAGPSHGPLLDVLERELRRRTGVVVPRAAWDWSRVPDHLRVSFSVVSPAGESLATGKDLAALQAALAPQLQQAVSSAAAGLERTGLTTWSFATVPSVVTSGAVQGYPALVDRGSSVDLRVLTSPGEQARLHRAGVRRLLLLSVPSQTKLVADRLSNPQKLALSRNPHGSIAALLDDCTTAAADALIAAPVWDEAAFATLREAVRGELHERVFTVVTQVEQVLARYGAVTAALAAEQRAPLAPAVADMQEQLARLVFPGFVTATGAARLPDLVRYLRGIERRIDKLPNDWERDRISMSRVAEVTRELATLPPSDGARELRWMVEELRVSLFAQPLRTAYPVSEKRIYRAMDDLLG
ncbi:MAG: helicase [Frankiales bacterium]|nr:helicase [Frankiales bacterium]